MVPAQVRLSRFSSEEAQSPFKNFSQMQSGNLQKNFVSNPCCAVNMPLRDLTIVTPMSPVDFAMPSFPATMTAAKDSALPMYMALL